MLDVASAHVGADYLLTNGAARLLDVAPQTIRLWERTGKLPALRTESGVRLFSRCDVERLARERAERRAGAMLPPATETIAS